MNIHYFYPSINQAEDIYNLFKKIDSETKFMVYEKSGKNKIKIGLRFIRSLINSSSQEKDFFVIAINGSTICGYIGGIVGRFRNNNNLIQFEVAVLERYQNRGIATNLISLLEIWARKKNLEVIELNVLENNTKAINLYIKLGFEIVSRKVSKEKLDGKEVYELNMKKYIVGVKNG